MLLFYPLWLPRYQLFLKPFFYILGAVSLTGLFEGNSIQYFLSAVIILLYVSSWHTHSGMEGGSLLERNMDYVNLVDTYKKCFDFISSNHPDSIIVAVNDFPAGTFLAKYPEAGYVEKPFITISLDEGLRVLRRGCVKPEVRYFSEWGVNDSRSYPERISINDSEFIFISEGFRVGKRFSRVADRDYAYGTIKPIEEINVNNGGITLYGVDKKQVILPEYCRY